MKKKKEGDGSALIKEADIDGFYEMTYERTLK